MTTTLAKWEATQTMSLWITTTRSKNFVGQTKSDHGKIEGIVLKQYIMIRGLRAVSLIVIKSMISVIP